MQHQATGGGHGPYSIYPQRTGLGGVDYQQTGAAMYTIPQNQTLMTQVSGGNMQQQMNTNKGGGPEAGSSHNHGTNQQQTGGGASMR